MYERGGVRSGLRCGAVAAIGAAICTAGVGAIATRAAAAADGNSKDQATRAGARGTNDRARTTTATAIGAGCGPATTTTAGASRLKGDGAHAIGNLVAAVGGDDLAIGDNGLRRGHAAAGTGPASRW